MEVIQSFEPIPLYEVMEGLGYERHTEKKVDTEFHAYFYRSEIKTEEKDIPMRPAALTNMPLIDEKLGNIAVNFWDLTSMMKLLLPRFLVDLIIPRIFSDAKGFVKECRRSRIDLDEHIQSTIKEWITV